MNIFSCYALFLLLSIGEAARFFTSTTAPHGLSVGCTTALLANVACSPSVPALELGIYYPITQLTTICTAACATALSSYHSNILSACAADTWEGFDDEVMPVPMISELIRYHYNGTCLSDGTRFCNNVAAAFSVFSDPAAAALPGGAPAGGEYGGLVITDPCDLCLVKALQFQVGSPYYNGLDLQSSSLYQSKTSSCGIANAPLTTTTLSIITPTTTTTTTPTCAGSTYAIAARDTCHTISISQGIGTSWLLTDNSLTSSCVDFPTTGSLCIVNTCEIYTLVTGDTCKAIAKANGITEAQFHSFNPSIDAGCYNLERLIGDQVCIGIPGRPYTPPPQVTLAPSIPITAAPIPTDVADGTNTYCGTYYEAIVGDYCNLIVMKFAISLQDFVFLNPAINANCTNLFAEESYCVRPVGDINTYSGRPGYQSITISRTSIIGDPATLLHPVLWSSPTATTTQMPIATDTRDDCTYYFKGDAYQQSLEGTLWKSSCDFAAAVLAVSFEDLYTWNPALSNVTENCSFQPGVRYCGQYFQGSRPAVPDVIIGLPIRDGASANCIEYVDVPAEGGPDCASILTAYSITIATFFRLNPSVGSDCSGLWAGYQYCIADQVTTTTSSTTATPTSTPIMIPEPNQPNNAISTCNKFAQALDGDWCARFAERNVVSLPDLYAWNAVLGADGSGCGSSFWKDYWYCVGVGSASSTTTSSTTSTPTPTPTSVVIPTPNQAGNAIATCNKFAQALDGDWCALFAERNVVTLPNLYAWNSVLGADGSGCGTSFWKDYWYCVGVRS